MNDQTKICANPKCRKEKPISEFDKSSRDGLKSRCKTCRKEERIKWYTENPNYNNQYYQEHKKEHRKRQNAYDLKHKDHLLKKKLEREKERYATDIQFKLSKNLRRRLREALKENYKSGSAVHDLGCSIEFLKQYFESKFYPHPETNEPMSWNNYGYYGWHIDHIKPLASFDLADRKQLLEAVHYINLQPLWWFENLSKG